jgi:hypothetical protein
MYQFYDIVTLQFKIQRCDFKDAMNTLKTTIVIDIIILKQSIKALDIMIKDVYQKLELPKYIRLIYILSKASSTPCKITDTLTITAIALP